MTKWILFSSILVLPSLFQLAESHGRLIEPPSRASMWRYGFSTPPNYNDHELYCGGFTRQWQTNGGKCGICGDAWDLPKVSCALFRFRIKFSLFTCPDDDHYNKLLVFKIPSLPIFNNFSSF